MSTREIETTLFRALEKSKADGALDWKVSAQKKTRFIADLGIWRMRIESEGVAGEHPFKFSLLQPGSGKGEIDFIRSAEANRPLLEEERKVNQALRELWELARRQVQGVDQISELNSLLDALN